jgi:hypothetical protein
MVARFALLRARKSVQSFLDSCTIRISDVIRGKIRVLLLTYTRLLFIVTCRHKPYASQNDGIIAQRVSLAGPQRGLGFPGLLPSSTTRVGKCLLPCISSLIMRPLETTLLKTRQRGFRHTTSSARAQYARLTTPSRPNSVLSIDSLLTCFGVISTRTLRIFSPTSSAARFIRTITLWDGIPTGPNSARGAPEGQGFL